MVDGIGKRDDVATFREAVFQKSNFLPRNVEFGAIRFDVIVQIA